MAENQESEQVTLHDELPFCPECNEQTVIVETAPMAPARMACRECDWVSIPGRTA